MIYSNASEPKEFLEFKGEHLHALKYEKERIVEKLHEMTV